MCVNKVVILLIYDEQEFLLQLRDFKSNILYPGRWGLFSGSLEMDETPTEAANRELFEELDISNQLLDYAGEEQLPNYLSGSYCYYYAVNLSTSRHILELKEGADCGWFGLHEINSGLLYSKKFMKPYPVIDAEYIRTTLSRLDNCASNRKF